MKHKRVFIICSVRDVTTQYRNKLEQYVAKLESDGYIVHLPHRDTHQDGKGIEICKQNRVAIETAEEVHVFYASKSQGTHFDLGMAFALGKSILVIENEEYGLGKSFPRMLEEWANDN